MGDRANIFVLDYDSDETSTNAFTGASSPAGVYLYAHWGGEAIPHLVHEVLKKRQRWEDPPYLARMLFCEMVRGDERGETGFGISSQLGDNEHAIVAVDCERGRVAFCEADALRASGIDQSAIVSWTFDEYVALSSSEIEIAFREADEQAG